MDWCLLGDGRDEDKGLAFVFLLTAFAFAFVLDLLLPVLLLETSKEDEEEVTDVNEDMEADNGPPSSPDWISLSNCLCCSMSCSKSRFSVMTEIEVAVLVVR